MQNQLVTLQITIERLLDQLARAGVSLSLLRDMQAYARERTRLSEPGSSSIGPVRPRRPRDGFALRFEMGGEHTVAAVAVCAIDCDDLLREIESGRLWHEGGFAAWCDLSGVTCCDISRLVGGRVSVVDLTLAAPSRLAAAGGPGGNASDPVLAAGLPPEAITVISLLAQALAIKHQESDFVAILPSHALGGEQLEALGTSFESVDPCVQGLMPGIDQDVHMPLMHTSRATFLEWAEELADREAAAPQPLAPARERAAT